MLYYVPSILFFASVSLAASVARAPVFRVHRGDPQTSTTLEHSAIQTAWENDGAASGATPSLTSPNNFINWCLTTKLPFMNGSIQANASCNPVPMGAIPSSANMPSVKFIYPSNFATIPASTTFTIQLAIRQLVTGDFSSATTNWYAAPQQLDGATGFIKGHSHFSIEALTSFNQTEPNDPSKYAFFAAVPGPAVDGVLSQIVTGGLPAGFYKLASMNAAANHQPVVVGIPNHASLDDAVYFTVA